jgi:hypothetical protein
MTERQQELLNAVRVLMLGDKTPTLEAIADVVGASSKHSIYKSIRSMRNAGILGDDNRPTDGVLPGEIVGDLRTWLDDTPSARVPAEIRQRIELLTGGEK